MHGLLDKQFLNNLKTSSSFNENAFATEYLSRWLAVNSDSWYNYDKINTHRTLKNPHWKAKKFPEGLNGYYLMSWDVARYNDMSVVCVFRNTINPTTGQHKSSLVMIKILGLTPQEKTFTNQAIAVKQMIAEYMPREVVIDTNGLGVGAGDAMIQTQVAPDGTILPAYGFINDENYRIIQPNDAPKILYGIKANGNLKADIEANAFNRVNQGMVNFLIKEQEAKNELMATQVGQKMKIEDKINRLLPHEMTTRLIDEIMNLKLKANVGGKITLEPINTSMHDDRYMCMAYGLWRIKELEEQSVKIATRPAKRQLVFGSINF